MKDKEQELIPIPNQAVEFARKVKAKAAIENMQLEIMLLKHLVATLDDEHDYLFNPDELKIIKVRKVTDGKESLQLSPSENSKGREEAHNVRGAKGLREFADDKNLDSLGQAEETVEEKLQPPRDKEGN
jgi:hypothetical protein